MARGEVKIDRDCFNRHCLLPAPIAEVEFERRFRMSRSVYEQQRKVLQETDGYFLQKQDSLGKLGASTDKKMVCDLHQQAYGFPADSVCEYECVSESTDSASLLRFARRFDSGSRRNGFEGLTRMSLLPFF
jgi:hypothetical protein